MISSPALQRDLAERLLLGALHEHDAVSAAEAAAERATCVSRLSRELALSLDESQTRATVARTRLPRAGTWCIIDVIEPDGSIHRLPVSHPDPSKAAIAKELEDCWLSPDVAVQRASTVGGPTVLSHMAGSALLALMYGETNLALLNRIGFSYLLLIPIVVRASVHGAMIFVAPKGASAFSAEETALGVDLAARCGLALENARLYKEADTLRAEAQQANVSKSAFLASMSHELRTPLNAIGGYAELMELGIQGPVTELQRLGLTRIKANQQALLVLVTEILDFAQLERGGTRYELSEVVIPEALSSVADLLGPAITAAGLRVVRPEADPTAVAWADPRRVRQILLNLMGNAVKYGGRPGGTVTLECTHVGDVVTASVEDTGAGISAANLESIFEPFVQLPAGLTNRRGGVGLGLAISRDLAHGMGGEISVTSTVGVGTRFTLTLPSARRLSFALKPAG